MDKLIKKIVLFVLVIVVTSSQIFATTYLYKTKESTNNKTKKISSAESSISTSVNLTPPEFKFQSVSQILIEPSTGTVLYANNENEKLLPASVTKIMSLLLIMEQIDEGKLAYTDKIKCSATASKMGGSQIWFKVGEELTVEDCLKAICVVSANDVTVAMAEHIAGSQENFVKKMNEKAKELGMENTSFKNSHGIDEEGHYTTAKDISIMSRELIVKHPDILKFTSIWMDTLRDGTFGLTNTNKLIRFYDGANGLKTGSTSQALFNLASTATRNGTTFLAVVMRAPSSDIRAEESTQLLNYAFSNFEIQNIYEKDAVIEDKIINKCITDTAQIAIGEDVTVLKNKGSKVETQEVIEYNDAISAPIKANTPVGKIQVLDKNTSEVLGEKDLIVLNDISNSNFLDYLKELFRIFLFNVELSEINV
ncbi:MAG: D-alanyl-D-alanine carboxypeptidase [Clostridia bacterium]|nr:D-alanyl-D-alanine carboxypeptidase [Clostridia bacterium]